MWDHCALCGVQFTRRPVSDDRLWQADYRLMIIGPEHVAARDSSIDALTGTPSSGYRGWGGVRYEITEKFHHSCLCLLQAAYGGTRLPDTRLVLVCKCRPFYPTLGNLCWQPIHTSPFQHHSNDTRSDSEIEETYNDGPKSDFVISLRSNPLDIPFIHDIINNSRNASSPSDNQVSGALCEPVRILNNSTDCFQSLPSEINFAIITHLDLHESLSMRLVSRAFSSLLNSSSYWKLQFGRRQKFGYFFEAHTQPEPIDWRELRRSLRQNRDHPALLNRKRIWDLAQVLCDLADLCLGDVDHQPAEHDPTYWTRLFPQEDYDDRFLPETTSLCNRRAIFTQMLTIPQNLVSVYVMYCMITCHGTSYSYICGLRFVQNNGKSSTLGYHGGGSKEVRFGISEFRGFLLAVGWTGIHALRVADGSEDLLPWVGNRGEAPITERHLCNSKVTSITVQTDAFKIMDLVLTDEDAGNKQARPEDDLFRKDALWHPQVPSNDQSLNLASAYWAHNPLGKPPMPVWFAHFGGTHGSLLTRLCRITFELRGFLRRVKFHYTDDEGGTLACSIGRPSRDCYGGLFESFRTQKFEIDGAGGERLERIEITRPATSRDEGLNHGHVDEIKIMTNRGRSFVGGSRTGVGKHTFRKIDIVPGTTITGLYATDDVSYGLEGFGVVSEVVD